MWDGSLFLLSSLYSIRKGCTDSKSKHSSSVLNCSTLGSTDLNTVLMYLSRRHSKQSKKPFGSLHLLIFKRNDLSMINSKLDFSHPVTYRFCRSH